MAVVDPARLLAASTEITSAALSGDDPDAVLSLIVTSAAQLAKADLGLAMISGADGRLTVEASSGEAEFIGVVISHRSAAARAARAGIPMAADDFVTDPRTAPFVPKQLRGYGPFVVAPFGTKERKIGALAVYRKRSSSPFRTDSVNILSAFAAQAGLAVVLAEGATARARIAVYQERERIARDLHDVIIQRLYATGMQLDMLDKKLGLTGPDAVRLTELVDQLDATIADIRTTVKALRQAGFSEGIKDSAVVSLAESIHSEAVTAAVLLGFPPVITLSGDFTTIPAEIADHARAALREALSNVVRHSGASAVAIEATRDLKTLIVKVIDNGCGIPADVAERGLRHLVERAHAASGQCEVVSSPEIGTTVIWQAPLS